MTILITGTAGFIGYHLTKRLAKEDHSITCLDNINEYYDTDLKFSRLNELGIEQNSIKSSDIKRLTNSTLFPKLNFYKLDISDKEQLNKLFTSENYDIVIHLAAQAGVRYSLDNPDSYINSNIQGFFNILEACKLSPPKHFVYASSSSVYGLNTKIPFSENDTVNQPASLYAVTKRSNELLAYTYSHLYGIPVTGLRFFTVYGPWGRPDMAPYIFTKSIVEGKPIDVFNNGNMQRDFTFIDDIIEGIVRVINIIPKRNNELNTPSSIYNIGNGRPIQLMDFIYTLEETLDKKAIINYAPMQKGDVVSTWADCSSLERVTGFRPQTDLSTGIRQFIDWYKNYHK